MYMYIFAILQTVVTKHTKLDAPEVGASVFRFVGTLGEEGGDRVILVRCHLQCTSRTHAFYICVCL